MRISAVLIISAVSATGTASRRADAFTPQCSKLRRFAPALAPPSTTSLHLRTRRCDDDNAASFVSIVGNIRGGAFGRPKRRNASRSKVRSKPSGSDDPTPKVESAAAAKIEGGDPTPGGGGGGRRSGLGALCETLASLLFLPRAERNGGDERRSSIRPIGHRSFVGALRSVRTYRRCVLYVLGYLALSVWAYSYTFESWPIVDSLYFAVTCFTSVGYGDICPKSNGAKIFTAFFVLYGISILGIALGVVGSRLLEAEKNAFGKAGDAVKRRLLSQFRKGSDKGLDDEPKKIVNRSVLLSVAFLLLNQLPILALIEGLALLIGHIEGWSVTTSLYYGIITTTTVGLGDFSPTSRLARILSIFFIPISVAVLGELLGRVAGFVIDREAERAELEFLSRDLTEEDLALMDENENGEVDLAEFMTFMLVTMGKVDRETMDKLRETFEYMDVEANGVLNQKDLKAMALKKRKESKV